MQWKNYLYEKIREGVKITQYLAETESVDLLAGTGKSLLFDLVEEDCIEEPDSETILDDTFLMPETEIQIPSYINDYPVVEIGEEAFSEYGALLTRIEVPPTVKHIGSGAFKMCMSLTDLELHDGLETIGEEAFYLTPMTELYLPSTVSYIGRAWELGNVQWHIDEKNPHFFCDGCGLYRSICTKEAEEIELLVVSQSDECPEYAVAAGTTVIGENALAGNATLQRVVLPPTVHTIGQAAFESCQNLLEVLLPEGLREIQAEAFSHCIRLKQIHLPSTVERLGSNALSDTFGWSDSLIGLEKITVEKGNHSFQADEDALYEIHESERYLIKYFGRDREYSIPDNISRVLPGAFRRAKLHRLCVPKSVRDVAQDAFRECRDLEEIYLEESDAVLYVPVQPVYRKDEITALFCSFEREQKKGNPDMENRQPAELPEKWKAFAGTAIYSKTEDDPYDPYETYVYDYRGYDALFHTYLNLPDQCGMACCRLKYPVQLLKEVQKKYEVYLRENLSEILQGIAEAQDMNRLADLAELGFFTEENIEECMEVFNRSGRTAMMSYLLNYKTEKLSAAEFDFEL